MKKSTQETTLKVVGHAGIAVAILWLSAKIGILTWLTNLFA